jgi:hypothetical protein
MPRAKHGTAIRVANPTGVPVDLGAAYYWLDKAVVRLDPGIKRSFALDAREQVAAALVMPPD